jgi:hypothetical protein
MLRLNSVTKLPDQTYDQFILRAASNPIGRSVKLADLADNCDLSRIPKPTTRDFKRLEKYRHAIETINAIEHPDAYRVSSCQSFP